MWGSFVGADQVHGQLGPLPEALRLEANSADIFEDEFDVPAFGGIKDHLQLFAGGIVIPLTGGSQEGGIWFGRIYEASRDCLRGTVGVDPRTHGYFAKVGQVAAEIRAYRPPEPYKGKGVKYADEIIVRKEAKKK